jgi:dTDP-4-dehydrorhamnose 3,5-epimerase
MAAIRVEATAIPEVRIVTPPRFADPRGFFCETYSRDAFRAAGIAEDFVQDNQSHSSAAGTIRGLHFQTPPFAQAKLVRVAAGRIFDVAVDLRGGSPHFGRHVAVALSAQDGRQLLVPAGFAHGFCTLEPDTVVLYKVTNPYAPAHDRGLAWDDPALGIAWPVRDGVVLSDRDRRHPRLRDLPASFP